jgi:hypothetical protein
MHAKTRNRELRRLTIALPVDLYDELTDAAYDDMTSVAALTRRAIAVHLRRRSDALSR